MATYYTGGDKGYTDYPTYQEQHKELNKNINSII